MLYFIVNETSRTGKSAGVWNELEQLVTYSGLEYQVFKTEYEGHATELASQICDKADDDICLIVVGGDGTMNEVLNGMTSFEKVRFGMIPMGSGNDFGRGLNLPKDPRENWNMIQKHVLAGKDSFRQIDLGQVTWQGGKNPRLFGISAGIGLDAIVCKKALRSGLKTFLNRIHLGKLTYILLTVQTLFAMDTADAEVTYSFDKEAGGMDSAAELKHLSGMAAGADVSVGMADSCGGHAVTCRMEKMIFSAAMNLRAEGGGVPMAPKGNPYDGKLSTSSAYGIPKWRTFFCLPLLVAAKHEKLKGFRLMDGKSVHISLSKPMIIHADGEYCGESAEVTFTCLPKQLKMLMD
jgi:diacylglycerol kinase family enzyme